MKILLIYNAYRYSGGEDTYFSSISRLLTEKGNTVISYTKSNRDIPNTLSSKISVGLGLFHNPEMLSDLTDIIQKYKPDIAQVQNIYPLFNPSIYPLLRSFHIPVIQRIANYRYMCPKMSLFRDGKVCTDCVRKVIPYPSVMYSCYNNSRLASLGFSLSHSIHSVIFGSYRYINTYLFPSEFIRDFYIKNVPISKENTTVIPSFYLKSNAKKNIIQEDTFILFIGRLTQEKGIDLLMDTIKNVPQIKLVIIGNGPLKQKVIDTTKKYSHIIYKGHLSKECIISYIKKARFVVMPSKWYDVLPNVLIESFAMGKTIIAPRFGVFPELIKDGENGLLYNYNNSQDLRKKIHMLFYSKKLLQTFNANALKEYKNKYTKIIHYKKLMQLYSTVLKKNGNIETY